MSSLRFTDITEEQVLQLLRPRELAQRRAAEREAAAKKAQEQEAEAKEAGEDEGEEETIPNNDGDELDAEAEAEALLLEAEAKAMAEAKALEETACSDPADEAERRAKIVREIVFGEGAGEEDGDGDSDEAERTAVLIDYLVGCVHFAEESGLNDEQVSVVFAIAKRLFSFSRSGRGSKGEAVEGKEQGNKADDSRYSEEKRSGRGSQSWAPRAEAYSKFTSMVADHAMPNDELDGRRVFGVKDVDILTRYFSTTFFRHYKSYEYAFTYDRAVETVQSNVVVQTPMLPKPLIDAEELILTAEEKEEAARQEAEARRQEEGEVSWNDGDDGNAEEKQMALDAAEAALNSLERESKISEEAQELDERLERAIDERVRQQTQMLEQKLDDLRALADSLTEDGADSD